MARSFFVFSVGMFCAVLAHKVLTFPTPRHLFEPIFISHRAARVVLRRREAGAWPYAFRMQRDLGDPSTGLAGAAEVALEMRGGPTDAMFLCRGEGGLPGGGETSYCAGTRPVHTQMHCVRGGTRAVAQSAAPARGRSRGGGGAENGPRNLGLRLG